MCSAEEKGPPGEGPFRLTTLLNACKATIIVTNVVITLLKNDGVGAIDEANEFILRGIKIMVNDALFNVTRCNGVNIKSSDFTKVLCGHVVHEVLCYMLISEYQRNPMRFSSLIKGVEVFSTFRLKISASERGSFTT